MSLIIILLSVLLTAARHVSAYTPLSDASLAHLPPTGTDFDIHNGALLAPILRVRIPDTPEIEEVRQHFVRFFQTVLPKWNVAFQNSTQNTPLKQGVRFSNLIITRDPPWAKPGNVGRLNLVAHYDSKITPKGFIGATDSAAPCAMLLHAARSIDDALSKKWADMEKNKKYDPANSKGVQLILLDGEEAFLEWSDRDSIYGARSLAAEWDAQMSPALSTYKSDLASINLFVLLDLLGAAGPTIPSYFPVTHEHYKVMANAEKRLRELGQLKSAPNYAHGGQVNTQLQVGGPWFFEINKTQQANPYWMGGMIEDDHIPFFQRGVEILHIIPADFPSVWHTPEDDGEHLDIPTVEDWAQVTTVFAAEWLELEGFMPKSVKQRSALHKRHEANAKKTKRDEL